MNPESDYDTLPKQYTGHQMLDTIQQHISPDFRNLSQTLRNLSEQIVVLRTTLASKICE
jgi:hypothetical protein